jgi:hypothetical protein
MTLTSAADYLEWNPSATEGLELLQIWPAFDAGAADLNEHRLEAGDTAVTTEEGMVEVEAHRPSEPMLVDTQL